LWETSYSTSGIFDISSADWAICVSLAQRGVQVIPQDDLSAYEESERSKYGMFGNFWDYYPIGNTGYYDETSSFDRFGTTFADYRSSDGQGFRPAKEIFDLGIYDNMEVGDIPLASSGEKVTILCKKDRKGAVSRSRIRSIRYTEKEKILFPIANVVQI
jgi:hypothetical protein